MQLTPQPPRRRCMMFWLLELYAVILAWIQYGNGVRTDEAKYLLNIPYPHPPFARFILHLNDGWAYQELFWRIVFATLLVQAVWLILQLAEGLPSRVRIAIGLCWVFSSAVMLQTGTVMMAPLTALEALVFLFLLLRDDETNDVGLIGILWLLSLFTAYQAILFAPIVLALLYRSKDAMWKKVAAFLVPILLLTLYTFSNPLVLASMTIHAEKDSSDTPIIRLIALLHVWFLGGGIIVSVVGLYGIIREQAWSLLCSFFLIAAYVLLSRFDYYAILFTPLCIAGFLLLLQRRHIPALPVAIGTVVVSFFAVLTLPIWQEPSPARRVMHRVSMLELTKPVLIDGPFGHEWQYESAHLTLLRYSPSLINNAGAVICTAECSDMEKLSSWKRLGQSVPAIYIQR